MSDPLWNYVKLLMHCDGIDGSLRIVDERHAGFNLTGNAAISSLEKKFGGASLRFDGSADYAATTAGSSSYAVAAGTDFAIEFFAFPRDTTNASPIAFGLGNVPGTGTIWIGYDWATAAGKWGFFFGTTSTTTPVLVSTSSVVYEQWVHIAVTRSGSTVRLFVNGVIEATTTISGSMVSGSPPIWISASAAANNYYGYLDEIRYTVGAARYTANFTPPTAPFGHGEQVYDAYYDNVVLHSHLDGEHNGTTFIDRKGHQFAGNGTAKTSTTAAKAFGGTSAALAGSYLKTSSPDFIFGSGDFTIEWWEHRSSNSGAAEACVEMPNAGNTDMGLSLRSVFNGTGTLRINGTDVASWNGVGSYTTITHQMIVREGSTIAHYRAGVRTGTYSIGSAAISSSGDLFFGKSTVSSPSAAPGSVSIDEIRVTKGLARVSPSLSAFTPPTEPFPDYVPQKLTGTVRDSAGNPIARTVRAYRSSDGLLVDSAVSDGVTGGFSLRATDLSEHFVVVHDPVKNALVYDHITPVL